MRSKTNTSVVNPALAARQASGLTQEDFAARYGFALKTLRNWEQGQRNPDTHTLIVLRAIELEPTIVGALFERARKTLRVE